MIEVDVTHRLGDFQLDAHFVSEGRLTALLGHSGAGKTSIINVIAGLIRPQKARIAVDGDTLVDTSARIFLPAHRRRLGVVFQEGRLFPHLNVRQNLLYGAWFAGSRRSRAAFDEVLALLGIENLLQRYPESLSGGEKQRVAIGRALLASARLILMDEPLASLDEPRKQEIIPYLERIRDHTSIPIIYVSHAVAEVARLADTLVVLADGKVAAVGPTVELMHRLDLIPAGGTDEAGAVIDTTVESHDDSFGLTTLASRAGKWKVPRLNLQPGRPVRIWVRARDVMIAQKPPEQISALNVIHGRVAEIGASDGPAIEIKLDCSGEALIARLTRYSAAQLSLQPGMSVYAIVKSVSFSPWAVGAARDITDM